MIDEWTKCDGRRKQMRCNPTLGDWLKMRCNAKTITKKRTKDGVHICRSVSKHSIHARQPKVTRVLTTNPPSPTMSTPTEPCPDDNTFTYESLLALLESDYDTTGLVTDAQIHTGIHPNTSFCCIAFSYASSFFASIDSVDMLTCADADGSVDSTTSVPDASEDIQQVVDAAAKAALEAAALTAATHVAQFVPRTLPTTEVQDQEEQQAAMTMLIMAALGTPAFDGWSHDNSICSTRYSSSDTASTTATCMLCGCVSKSLEDHRHHIGAHVCLERKLGINVPRCGYCGMDMRESGACRPQLELLSSNITPQASRSSCRNGCWVENSAKSMCNDGAKKCNNYPMHCTAPGCGFVDWKYNMHIHWNSEHPDFQMPREFELLPQEAFHMDKLISVYAHSQYREEHESFKRQRLL